MLQKAPCIRIKLTDTKPSIFDSKVGGLGYLPHDAEFPCNSEGKQLRLLAQIDCSQIDYDPFPKTGLLQFWILNDDMYGCDFDNPTSQDTFRVIYYPDLDRTVTEQEIADKFVKSEYDEEDLFPVSENGEYGIAFATGESYQRPEVNFDEDADVEEEERIWDEYSKLTGDDANHQIGGYAFFTQNDPRLEDSPYDFLLFQLDSDVYHGKERVLWGDVGIGNFFINSEKLKQLDFTDVMYNWDCG